MIKSGYTGIKDVGYDKEWTPFHGSVVLTMPAPSIMGEDLV